MGHYLIGVSAHSVTLSQPAEEIKSRRRDVKKNLKLSKNQAKAMGQEGEAVHQTEAANADLFDDSTPLRVNLMRFVAEERKSAIIAFA